MQGVTSFKSRLMRGFLLFSLLFLFLLVAFIFMTYQAGKEGVIQSIFVSEVEQLIERRSRDPSAPLPHGWIRSYEDPEDIPEPWRSNLERFEPEDVAGIPLREWKEVQMWSGTLPGSSGTVYLFANHQSDLGELLLTTNLTRLVVLAALVTLLFVGWLSRLFSRRLARALEELQERIDAYKPLDEGIEPPRFGDREIQRLAESFRQLHRRVDDFVKREQEFTRHASHELRTPITVIRAAGSVLQQRLVSSDERVKRAVVNLVRAADDMTLLVNTFLWMAREDMDVELDASFEAGDCVRMLCEHHRLLLRPGVDLSVDVRQERLAGFPGTLFGIAASNLIRNAVQNTRQGSIHVTLDPDRLTVTNPHASPEERGVAGPIESPLRDGPKRTSLGLKIVDRICQRCGWTRQLDTDPSGHHIIAVLRFGAGP